MRTLIVLALQGAIPIVVALQGANILNGGTPSD